MTGNRTGRERRVRAHRYSDADLESTHPFLGVSGLQRAQRDRRAGAGTHREGGGRRLLGRSGYYKYFAGEGIGSSEFSWTAALTLDLLAQVDAGVW
jgi:hypothetical protein